VIGPELQSAAARGVIASQTSARPSVVLARQASRSSHLPESMGRRSGFAVSDAAGGLGQASHPGQPRLDVCLRASGARREAAVPVATGDIDRQRRLSLRLVTTEA